MTDAAFRPHSPFIRRRDALPGRNGARTLKGEDGGNLVGSGTGRVQGPRINGNPRWSNFEQVFADYCCLNVAGMIETDDGAEIRFDSLGFAVPPAGLGAWKVASAVRFVVNDSRYRWLETAPAIWEREFEATAATARYRAYLPSDPRDDES